MFSNKRKNIMLLCIFNFLVSFLVVLFRKEPLESISIIIPSFIINSIIPFQFFITDLVLFCFFLLLLFFFPFITFSATKTKFFSNIIHDLTWFVSFLMFFSLIIILYSGVNFECELIVFIGDALITASFMLYLIFFCFKKALCYLITTKLQLI